MWKNQRQRLMAFCLFLLVLASSNVTFAQRRSSGGTRSSGTVHVKSYTKKDGTVVRSHTRSSPRSHRSSSSVGNSTETASGSIVNFPANSSNGRIKRSEAARRNFMRETGYPHGRPGYVVDHKVALACGGLDAPSNMQWQTIAEAKAKDKVERKGCK